MTTRQPLTSNELPASVDPRAVASSFVALMEGLLTVIERETALVRVGKLAEAAVLSSEKSDLAGRFLAISVRLKSHARAWFGGEPALLEELRKRQDVFRSRLQANLTVLATAHAVAEGIIRGAAGEIARKAVPSGYGAKGYASAPPARAAAPVTLSRTT